MAFVQIRIADKVLARTLEILLTENGITPSIADSARAKIPDGCVCIITDPKSADREVMRFENTFFICGAGEVVPEGKTVFKRPFPLDAFILAVLETLSTPPKAPTLSLDAKRNAVRLGRLSVRLTEKEFALFSLLYEKRGETVTDGEIVSRVFGGRTVEGSNIAAVYVSYLRKKLDERLGRRLIFSVRGKGYRLGQMKSEE